MQFDKSCDANNVFKKFAQSKIILRKMNNYKIKNSLRVTVGNAQECRLFIKLLDRIF
jgi:histidinol-phosphate/aromatic aminotransferase/cobyric acid decarboxylase-like protein|tara:strand:- start:668 stop:838 length:171 start_codon:yes stop_codon:yes gene_type:complete